MEYFSWGMISSYFYFVLCTFLIGRDALYTVRGVWQGTFRPFPHSPIPHALLFRGLAARIAGVAYLVLLYVLEVYVVGLFLLLPQEV